MSVALITVAVGERFHNYLPEWAAAASHLQTPPDEVIIVGDEIPARVRGELDALLPNWTWLRGMQSWRYNPQILANEAIGFSGSDWVCKIDADDLIYPHAFNALSECAADVCMFGISVNDERHLIPPRVTARDILASPHNLLFAGSPFRRDLWLRTPGYIDTHYDDWAFWRSCARAGATFLPTGKIDYLYRMHGGNFSTTKDHGQAILEMLEAERA